MRKKETNWRRKARPSPREQTRSIPHPGDRSVRSTQVTFTRTHKAMRISCTDSCHRPRCSFSPELSLRSCWIWWMELRRGVEEVAEARGDPWGEEA